MPLIASSAPLSSEKKMARNEIGFLPERARISGNRFLIKVPVLKYQRMQYKIFRHPFITESLCRCFSNRVSAYQLI